MNQVYLDNSSTTKPCKTAAEYVTEAVLQNWGNPSSLHRLGVEAEKLLTECRNAAASLIGADSSEIFFTSGGTESNNIALKGAAYALRRRGKRIVTSAIEHPSVLQTLDELEKEGFEVVRLHPDENGEITPQSVWDAVNSETILVSLMLVNNETGVYLPVREAKKAVKDKNAPALIHCDAVQAFGKMPISVADLGVDLLSASAHKIHGIKGCGILYKSRAARIVPTVFGGNQEKGIRSGTESVPAIAGLLGAIRELDVENTRRKMTELNLYARDVLSQIDGIHINSGENTLPFILNISLEGYRSETLLHFLESCEIYVSSGSACSKGKPSYVLTESRLPQKFADSALRLSFSRFNKTEDIDRLADALREAKTALRRSDGGRIERLRRKH